MSAANLELTIDKLILHDVPAGQRQRIAAAVEAALARLFDEQGIPAALSSGAALSALDVGPIDVAAGAGADAIGAQVAQSIYSSLAGTGRPTEVGWRPG